MNHYAYANSNPVMFRDPSGNMALAELGGAISIRGTLGSIGIDIEVWLEGKLVVLIDLKTGKKGFSLSRANDHSNRRGGNIPVIEIFIPFL